ncbi:hypothetical protein Acsp05_44290 [Actinokineospora sp. NBRC 105648]|nr:hypothetical protein Acsp05_44290 [Actinokineospora sp. NBRC 105648]
MRAESSVEERVRGGPCGAQESTGSPICVWRDAVPVVITTNLSHPPHPAQAAANE